MPRLKRTPSCGTRPTGHQEASGRLAVPFDVSVGRAKKLLGATERNEAARDKQRERGARRAAADSVVVDACGSKINVTPIYARAPKGVRAYGHVPRNTDKHITLIASITTAGMGPAMMLEGATAPAAFEGSVEHVLAPVLSPGTVVVIDNLSAHTRGRVRALIESRGCEVYSVPAYSPDLSPIDAAVSKCKALLRRAQARTRELLQAAIAQALQQITALDAQGYFAHCGYGTQLQ
jgi:transposase